MRTGPAPGIILEQQLRKRVAELQAYRRNGLRSLAQIEEYEAARRQREMDDARKKQRARLVLPGMWGACPAPQPPTSRVMVAVVVPVTRGAAFPT